MSQVTNPTRYLFRQALVSFIAIIAAIVAYNTIAVETGHHLLVVLGTMMVVEFVLRQEIKTTKHPAPKLQSFFAIIGCAAGYWLGQQMNYPTAGFFVGMYLGGVVVKIFLKSYFVRRLDQANC